MRRVIVIEYSGGIHKEYTTIKNQIDGDSLFAQIDEEVNKYRERYNIHLYQVQVVVTFVYL